MRPVLLALALAAAAAPLAAQQPGGAPGAGRPMMNPLAFQGPPEPGAFAKIVGLTAEQQPKYANLHQAYMKETKPRRDSVEAMRTAMREARASGATGNRGGMAAMRPLGEALNAQYEEFEASLGFLLTPPQQAKYDAWKASEREKMLEQMRQRRAAGGQPSGGR
jgi:Spy/CpxP family protein refolding chaperone